MSKETCKTIIEVCIIEKNAFIRRGLESFLERDCYKVFAELQSIQELIKLGKDRANSKNESTCDVCLLGVSLGIDTKEIENTLTTIKTYLPKTRIIILSSKLDEGLICALSKHADGYILNDISAEALMRSIDLVMLGEKIFPTAMAGMISRARQPWEKHTNSIRNNNGNSLSKREAQVLNCLANGDSNKVIANNLAITDATVKVHLKAILRKLSVSNRTQAALWAVNNFEDKQTLVANDRN
jgi:two-component system nitrate/nitrite response regulator NarL